MIPNGFYKWWLGGVIAGGVIVSIVTATAIEGITPEAAWGGGLASAVCFLLCLDTRGSFRWATAIPAILVLMIAASVYHQNTGRPIAAIGGVLGFLVYTVFGFIGVGIGKLTQRKGWLLIVVMFVALAMLAGLGFICGRSSGR